MKQIFLSFFPAPIVIGMALFIFLGVFIAILRQTFRKDEQEKQLYLSHLPLEEEN
jgi:hypothetical protein